MQVSTSTLQSTHTSTTGARAWKNCTVKQPCGSSTTPLAVAGAATQHACGARGTEGVAGRQGMVYVASWLAGTSAAAVLSVSTQRAAGSGVRQQRDCWCWCNGVGGWQQLWHWACALITSSCLLWAAWLTGSVCRMGLWHAAVLCFWLTVSSWLRLV